MQQHRWFGITLALSVGLTLPIGNVHAVGLPFPPGASPGPLHATPAMPVSMAASGQLLAAAPPAAKPTGALAQGIREYNRGYIAKAIPLLEQAARQNPQDEQPFLWLGRAHQKQGTPADLERAKLAYQKVLGINPSQREALLQLGEMLSWDDSRREEAVRLLTRAYELNPGDADGAKKLAQALHWQGKPAEALRYAGPIAHRYASDRKFMAEYAQMLQRGGQADKSLAVYQTLLQAEPKNTALKLDYAGALMRSGQKQRAQAVYAELAQDVQGTAQARQGDFQLAMAGLAFDLELYAEALKWDQQLPPAYQRQKDVQLRIARTLTRVYRVPEAIEHFHRLYDSGLLNAEEKLEYAEYLRMVNLEGDALPAPNLVERLYQDALQENPSNADMMVRLARYYAESDGRFADMVSLYRQALQTGRLSDPAAVRTEFLDYVKADKLNQAEAEQIFQSMLADAPQDIPTRKAYAEFLSWQPDRRTEAMRMYLELAHQDPGNQALWETRLDEVLKWHEPTTDLIPLYQDIVNLFPHNKTIWTTVARAYRNDKAYYSEAVETYGILAQRYPDDGTLRREWLGLLLSNAGERRNNIRMLRTMTEQDPGNLDAWATLGKLLSYEKRYGEAERAFETVLSSDPEHRDALVGKGYVMLWSGHKLKAKRYLESLRVRYPDDVDVAIALAQAEKLIGRYDEALRIIREIQPLMEQRAPESSLVVPPAASADFQWVEHQQSAPAAPLLRRRAVSDFSILPYRTQQAPVEAATPATQTVAAPEATQPTETRPDTSAMQARTYQTSTPKRMSESGSPVSVVPSALPPVQATVPLDDTPTTLLMHTAVTPARDTSSEADALRAQIDELNEAVKSLQALQRSARNQLDQIDQVVQSSRDVAAGETQLAPQGLDLANSPLGGDVYQPGERGMTPAYGSYAALDYDTNPLLSGLGRFRNDQLDDLQDGLRNDLRPMIRAGYMFSTQGGEPTTVGLRSYGFPNQVSLSLTPQLRVRGGIRPVRYYLPNGVSPDSTWGIEYGWGATLKYWDRLTLDGDMAVTHFTQSGTENITFQANAQYAFNDSIRARLGFRRYPQLNSLLSVAGVQANQGAFRNRDVLGQARENGVYVELNTNPFSQKIDWNLGYEWAFIDGSDTPTNYKNQAFTSLGYTHHLTANHQVRLGYEFLFFGYSKNATNGFFDTTSAGITTPVVSLRPVTRAHPGYVFGGYYSPSWFFLNAGRLDFRGNFFNKFLEYKLGGSIGMQNAGMGHGIQRVEKNQTSLATSFDGNLIMNLTDWLAAYGNVDFLNAGGQFNRWRFGGGLILRPHIQALSPVFGQAPGSHGAQP